MNPKVDTLEKAVKFVTRFDDIIDVDKWEGFDWWFDGKYWDEQDTRTREQKKQANKRLNRVVETRAEAR